MRQVGRQLGGALLALALIAAILLALEGSFRLYLKMARRSLPVVMSRDEVLKKAWFEPHPYLVYVFKPDHSFVMDAYRSGRFTTNKFGYRSTLSHDVRSVDKPPGTIRIAAIGGSTTMGVNDDDEVWPFILGERLQEEMPGARIEVLNAGVMGYTSLENLLDLSLRIIDFHCDVYIIYSGINDLLPQAPASIYRSDYSHFRRTLYENLSPGALLPAWLLRSQAVQAVLRAGGVPESRNLLDNTRTEIFRREARLPDKERAGADREMRRVVIRNLASMIGVIRAQQPEAVIILSSLFDLRGMNAVDDLNRDIEALAGREGVVFVDAAHEIPRREEMAYDYGHFTSEGDRLMGKLFARSAASALKPGTAR